MAQTASAQFGQCTLIIGSEPLLRERATNAAIKQARIQHPDAELISVDGASLAEQSILGLASGSLFAVDNIVVVNDLAQAPAAQLAAIVEMIEDIPDDLCLILVHFGGNKARSTVTKLMKKAINMTKVDPIKPYRVPQFLEDEARQLGVSIDSEAVTVLIDALGTDLRALTGAIAQLVEDYQTTRVTATIVRTYFGGKNQISRYDIADDIVERRFSVALEKLRWSLDSGESPVMILGAIATAFRTLGKYKDIEQSYISDAQVAQMISVPEWKVKTIRSRARRWSASNIAQAICFIAQADLGIKGAASDPGFVLEDLVTWLATESDK